MTKYLNRQEAGIVLAEQLKDYAGRENTLVFALPRGGVPVAFEVAKALKLPLDLFVVRKLGVPTHPELAMGAIASGGTVVYNHAIIEDLQISSSDIERVIQQESQELARRQKAYRGDQPYPDVIGKTIILIDDGIATGATMRAAINALSKMNAGEIIVAVPVVDASLSQSIAMMVDDFICPLRPTAFYAVGAWYESFPQVEDAEVKTLLKNAKEFQP